MYVFINNQGKGSARNAITHLDLQQFDIYSLFRKVGNLETK